MTLAAFFSYVAAYPVLALIIVLVLAVTLVSGATDAPNAIATAVSTRCMSPTAALILAAIFNFVGLVGMTYISTSVAGTMFGMVDFSGDTQASLYALLAAMVAAIFWGIFCWFKGIPASKSHSLIAGITGAAIAVNGWGGVVLHEWMKVIYGMVFSLVASFIIAWLVVKVVKLLFSHCDRHATTKGFIVVQDILAAFLAFLHGAQDGQKFMAIALLGMSLAMGMSSPEGMQFPMWLMIICSLAISVGTIIGGKRIIKSVAMDMVSLHKYQGVSASISTCITLLIASLTGMPVSTSHANTASIMGVGAEKSMASVKWDVAGGMVGAWILTFPCCGLIGWALTKLVFLL